MVRLRAIVEAFRSSLFFAPAVFVLGGVAAAEGVLALEAAIDPDAVPSFLRSTVDSAREIVSTIAGAIITVASVVFSVTVVALQLASSQFSPRILRGFLRNPLHQVVLGFVMATFTYCLLVLRTIRGPDGGDRVVPSLSVAVAVVLAIVTAVAILAFIDRSARSMQIGYLLRDIVDEAADLITRLPLTDPARRDRLRAADVDVPGDPDLRVRAKTGGWVQQMDGDQLLDAVPDGSLIVLAVRPGAFVAHGEDLCSVWCAGEADDALEARLRRHMKVGRERTMQQDFELGIRQLVDVGVRALSPGVNDLTSAYEVIAHMRSILRPLLLRDLPPEVVSDDRDRRLVRPKELSHADYVDRAFSQLRVAGAKLPSIAIAMLATMGMLRRELEAAGLDDRIEPLARQAALVVEEAEHADRLPHDVETVRRRFADEGFERAPSGRGKSS